jgi:hypothetical protein
MRRLSSLSYASFLQHLTKRVFRDFSNRVGCNGPFDAVFGIEPDRKILRTLACIAADTAESDVLASYDPSIVDNVFPRWLSTSLSSIGPKLNATVDTVCVAFDDLGLKPIWNLPSVHDQSSCRLHGNQCDVRQFPLIARRFSSASTASTLCTFTNAATLA